MELKNKGFSPPSPTRLRRSILTSGEMPGKVVVRGMPMRRRTRSRGRRERHSPEGAADSEGHNNEVEDDGGSDSRLSAVKE
jgi:hypothetical protein